ncbi:MAG TPA: hypothetical protein VKZ63_15230 [Kofleriaceae bacterium]|nr:hypothetical protein [Kofleriaceae bacterium]
MVALLFAAAAFGCGGDDAAGQPDSGSGDGPDAGPPGPDGSVVPGVPGIDPTFGDGGMVTVGFPGGAASIVCVARQPDGKIIGVGLTRESLVVVRLGGDGSFDPTFGEDGVVHLPGGVTFDAIEGSRGCAVQPDGKIVVAARVTGTPGKVGLVARLLPDGSLDTSFAGTGYRAGGAANAVALDGDGNIVVGGARLERLLPDGSPDPTFGDGGVVMPGLSIAELAIDPAGGILAVGGTRIARFTATGAADVTFGDGGVVEVASDDSFDQLFSLAIQPDGKVVVGGAITPVGTSSRSFWIGRFTGDGAPDSTFNGSGAVTGDEDTSGVARGVAVAPGGRIVGSGEAIVGGASGRSVRFTSGGALDVAFGDGGRGPSFPAVLFSNVALEPDGAFTAAGTAFDPDASAFGVALARVTAAGQPDAAFGASGLATRTVDGSFDRAHAVAVQPDGKILLGGWSASGSDAALIRLGEDGAIDASFAEQGVLLGTESLRQVDALAVQPDGKILVSGLSSGDALVVERYDTSGALDTSFGDGGVAGGPAIAGQVAFGLNMTISPGGDIVLVGKTGTEPGISEYAVLVLGADGTPAAAFGTGGGAASSFGTSNAMATHAVAKADGSVIVLGRVTRALGPEPTLVRFTAAGELDAAFGAPVLPGATGMLPLALAEQPDGAVVAVAGDSLTGELVVARYLPDGSLDDGFGESGVVTRTLAANDYALRTGTHGGLLILPDGRILIGLASASDDGLTESGVLLRLLPDGTPDESDGPGGVTAVSIGPGSTSIHALALDSEGRLLAVGRTWTAGGGSDFLALRFNP